MTTIRFTGNLKRHVDCPSDTVAGDTLAEALSDYFSRHPAVKSYILDDQDVVRKHMLIMIDGVNIQDRTSLSDHVKTSTTIDVFQALSGG